MSSRVTSLLLLSMLLIVSACTPRPTKLIVPDGLTNEISKANQAICSYKGRVSVVYKSERDDVRFKAYLNKDCQDNFRVKILGLFNSIAYDISMKDGELTAYKKDEDVSLEIAYFMRSKGLDSMISLIRYPHVRIDSTYTVTSTADEYILTRGVVAVSVGEDYLIRKISFGSEQFIYSYESGRLAGLTYTDIGTYLEIKLR